MIYLSSFAFPTRGQEDCFFDSSQPGFKKKNFRTVYTSKYPFNLFRDRELPVFEFSDITIFCGNNGSGKSTILNVIAEKIGLERGTTTEATFSRTTPSFAVSCTPMNREKSRPPTAE